MNGNRQNHSAPQNQQSAAKTPQVTTLPKGTRFEVFTIKEHDGNAHWTRAGVAFANGDGSLGVTLDSLPLDGKLHIRAPMEKQGHGGNRRPQ